jgi:hypothetical protein
MSTGICEVTCDPEINISQVLETADKKLYIEKKQRRPAGIYICLQYKI